MLNLKKASVADARRYFREELKAAVTKQRLPAAETAIDYLADMLIRFMISETFFHKEENGQLRNNVLADLYAAQLNGDSATRRLVLQRMGDVCMIVTGLFADSLARKTVDIDYYFGMGGQAYWQLSNLGVGKIPSHVFQELAKKFRPFSDVLGEIGGKTGIQNNTDLLKVYERWLFTGSERLRGVLSQQGIKTPVKLDPKIKH